MFNVFAFAHASGLIIWKSADLPIDCPIDQLLTLICIENRVLPSPYVRDGYSIAYIYIKELSMFALAVSRSGITIPGTSDIVSAMTQLFIREYEASIRVLPIEYSPATYAAFLPLYDANLKSLVSTGLTLEKRGIRYNPSKSKDLAQSDKKDDAAVGTIGNNVDESAASRNDGPEKPPVDLADIKSRIKQMTKERQETLRASRNLSSSEVGKKNSAPTTKSAKAGQGAEDFLQYSFVDKKDPPAINSISESHGVSSKSTSAKSLTSSQASGSIFGLFSNQTELTADDIEKLITSVRKSLINKNVASEVADELVKGLSASLEGRTVSLFSRIKPIVMQTLKISIANVIQFRSSSFLQEILVAKDDCKAGRRSRPYVICLVGVNGVGKTTTIAKLLYLFRNNGLKSLVCACDSFRSGAVEQLQDHCNRLDATLYSQGYGKNASAIAKYGIKEAERIDVDVCLIDTTGRQYNNGPLMQALGALVSENRPEIVIFVGEALTGNEGIEQLRQFDKALRSYTNSRGIDGIIVTKFDTCGDKVGSVLNLCFICQVPIIYVGTGQSYPDLTTLDPAQIADMIISK